MTDLRLYTPTPCADLVTCHECQRLVDVMALVAHQAEHAELREERRREREDSGEATARRGW